MFKPKNRGCSRYGQSRWLPNTEATGDTKPAAVLPSAIPVSGKLYTEILTGELVGGFIAWRFFILPMFHP